VSAFPSDQTAELDDGYASEGERNESREGLEELLEAAPLPFRSDIRRVVIRLQGGEEIEAGKAAGREAAVVIAREIVASIEDSIASGEWPEIGDRFLRPGAIVSIDVQRAS
jgi:hypothetical protein